jgi:uncharacterized protein
MPHVVALYRYPVKGFSPEPCEELTVLPEGRVAGDRVLGFRFADSATPDDAWGSKHQFVALVNTPGLAGLELRFDCATRRLAIRRGGAVLAEGLLDETGRARMAHALGLHVQTLATNPLSGHPERLPLRLVGDGVTPRYHDNEAGQVTLHGRASLAAVAKAVGTAEFSELRFRSNIAIEGIGAWEEQAWVGRTVRIGSVELDVVRHKTRCLATHANPATGERDAPVMETLVRAFGQAQPTFAVGMVTRGAGGSVRVGDAVRLIG